MSIISIIKIRVQIIRRSLRSEFRR